MSIPNLCTVHSRYTDWDTLAKPEHPGSLSSSRPPPAASSRTHSPAVLPWLQPRPGRL